MEKTVEVKSMDRRSRRVQGKLAGIKITGVQDTKEATLELYWIPMKRKSRNGVEHVYYKKVIDKAGLKK